MPKVQKFVLIILFSLITSLSGLAQFGSSVCFLTSDTIRMTAGAITSADFNKDGKSDLAVINSHKGVNIMLGNGAGGFADTVNFDVGLTSNFILSTDLDADGNIDLAMTNYFDSKISILLGDGSGGFGSANSFSVGSGPRSISKADFNNDGKIDLVVANFFDGNVSILLGDGLGSYASAYTVSTGSGSYPNSVTSADFNSDGKPDLAVADDYNDKAVILLGNSGAFSAPVGYSVDTGPLSISSSDFNKDGKTDLALACSGNHLSILLGNGTGGFANQKNFNIGSWAYSFAIADFNGDGNSDIAVANSGNNNISVLRGDGAGNFATAINFSVGSDPSSLTTADFNADGLPDLAVSNSLSNYLTILQVASTAPPTFSITQPTCVVPTGTITVTSQNASDTYSFDNGTTFQASNIASGLAMGSYQVTIRHTIFGCNSGVATATINAQPEVPDKPTVEFIRSDSGYFVLTANTASAYQWYKDGSLINDATSVIYKAKTTGSYSVVVFSASGCASIQSNVLTITVTGDIVKTSSIQFYPNPAKDYFLVSNVSSEARGIIMSMDGKTEDVHFNIVDDKIEFNVKHLTGGVYLLKLTDLDKIWIIRFVKF